MQQAKDTAENAFGGGGGISRHREEGEPTKAMLVSARNTLWEGCARAAEVPGGHAHGPGRPLMTEADRVLALGRETGSKLPFLSAGSAPITPRHSSLLRSFISFHRVASFPTDTT